MTKVLRRAALILTCLALAGCAGEGARGLHGDRPSDEAGPSGRPQRRLPNVFISPAGEPYRADPGAPYPVATWFARADANHDGRLTRDELCADGLAFFDRLDANHDGIIDGAEVQDYEQSVAPEILPHIESLHAMEGMDQSLTFGDPNNTGSRPQRRGSGGGLSARQPGDPTGIGVQGAAVYSLINTPEPIAAADAQLDGRITRTEFAAALDRRFDVLDKTGAGFLTLAALPKTPIQTELLKRAAQARHRKRRDTGTPPQSGDGAP